MYLVPVRVLLRAVVIHEDCPQARLRDREAWSGDFRACSQRVWKIFGIDRCDIELFGVALFGMYCYSMMDNICVMQRGFCVYGFIVVSKISDYWLCFEGGMNF